MSDLVNVAIVPDPDDDRRTIKLVRELLRARLANATEVSTQRGREDQYALGKFVEARDALKDVEAMLNGTA